MMRSLVNHLLGEFWVLRIHKRSINALIKNETYAWKYYIIQFLKVFLFLSSNCDFEECLARVNHALQCFSSQFSHSEVTLKLSPVKFRHILETNWHLAINSLTACILIRKWVINGSSRLFYTPNDNYQRSFINFMKNHPKKKLFIKLQFGPKIDDLFLVKILLPFSIFFFFITYDRVWWKA